MAGESEFFLKKISLSSPTSGCIMLSNALILSTSPKTSALRISLLTEPSGLIELGNISLIFSLLSFSLAIYLFTANFSYKIILIGIVTSIFCQIGDLFFSFLKRRAKIKDSGNFLPGHGGILDRLDGIFLGIPAGFFTLIYVIK